MLQICAICWL